LPIREKPPRPARAKPSKNAICTTMVQKKFRFLPDE
jgi:hypothetical protein